MAAVSPCFTGLPLELRLIIYQHLLRYHANLPECYAPTSQWSLIDKDHTIMQLLNTSRMIRDEIAEMLLSTMTSINVVLDESKDYAAFCSWMLSATSVSTAGIFGFIDHYKLPFERRKDFFYDDPIWGDFRGPAIAPKLLLGGGKVAEKEYDPLASGTPYELFEIGTEYQVSPAIAAYHKNSLFLYFGGSFHFEDSRVRLNFHRHLKIYGECRIRGRSAGRPELNILSCREAPWSYDPIPSITVLREESHPLEDESGTKLSCNCPRSVLSSQSERERFLICHRQKGRVFPEPGIGLPPDHWRATTADYSWVWPTIYNTDEPIPSWLGFMPNWRVYDPYGGEPTDEDHVAMAPTFPNVPRQNRRQSRRQSHNGRIRNFCLENPYVSIMLNARDNQSYDEATREYIKVSNCIFFLDRLLPCYICSRNTYAPDIILLKCGHYWCRPCAQFGVLQSFSFEFFPGCCGSIIPPEAVNCSTTGRLGTHYERKYLEHMVRGLPDVPCDRIYCQAILHPVRVASEAEGYVKCDACSDLTLLAPWQRRSFGRNTFSGDPTMTTLNLW